MTLSVDRSTLAAFSAANSDAGQLITETGSADAGAMLAAVAAAVGPIGAGYLAAFGPAQASHLSATLAVGEAHLDIARATASAETSFTATDGI